MIQIHGTYGERIEYDNVMTGFMDYIPIGETVSSWGIIEDPYWIDSIDEIHPTEDDTYIYTF